MWRSPDLNSICYFCCCSVAKSCATLWDTMDCSTKGFSFTLSLSLLKLISSELVMLSKHLILCHPFSSCLQSFPGSGSFPVSQLFTSGGQSIGASASVLSMNIQDWFPLGFTGFISLHSRKLSEFLPMSQFKSINSSVLNLIYGPTLTPVYDYWKNHSLD